MDTILTNDDEFEAIRKMVSNHIRAAGSTKMLDWIMPKGQNGEKFNFEKHVLPYLIPIICIMFVLALIFFFKMMHSGFKRSKGGGAAAVATAPPPTN